MQIKSCLKTQGLLNVIHYTVYLFISNIGTGSPGGRQRQAERPKSRRVNYQQNELFHPQPPPPAPRPPARRALAPLRAGRSAPRGSGASFPLSGAPVPPRPARALCLLRRRPRPLSARFSLSLAGLQPCWALLSGCPAQASAAHPAPALVLGLGTCRCQMAAPPGVWLWTSGWGACSLVHAPGGVPRRVRAGILGVGLRGTAMMTSVFVSVGLAMSL